MAGNEVSKVSNKLPQRPHDIFEAMRDEMSRMIETFEQGWSRPPRLVSKTMETMAVMPRLDVREDEKCFMVEAELPGVTEKDINVTLNNGILRIQGHKKQERDETKDNLHVCERSFGSFERALRLPDTIEEDKLEAHFEQGVLKIVAPKRPEAVKAEKKIEIKPH